MATTPWEGKGGSPPRSWPTSQKNFGFFWEFPQVLEYFSNSPRLPLNVGTRREFSQIPPRLGTLSEFSQASSKPQNILENIRRPQRHGRTFPATIRVALVRYPPGCARHLRSQEGQEDDGWQPYGIAETINTAAHSTESPESRLYNAGNDEAVISFAAAVVSHPEVWDICRKLTTQDAKTIVTYMQMIKPSKAWT